MSVNGTAVLLRSIPSLQGYHHGIYIYIFTQVFSVKLLRFSLAQKVLMIFIYCINPHINPHVNPHIFVEFINLQSLFSYKRTNFI
jgi:hypothetical protein